MKLSEIENLKVYESCEQLYLLDIYSSQPSTKLIVRKI